MQSLAFQPPPTSSSPTHRHPGWAGELAEEVLQRFGAGGGFLDVDAGFFAEDKAEEGFEDAAVAIRFAGFGAGANR
jgi:hypothetical protein